MYHRETINTIKQGNVVSELNYILIKKEPGASLVVKKMFSSDLFFPLRCKHL